MKVFGMIRIFIAAFVAVTLAGCGEEVVVEREPVVRPVQTMVVGGEGVQRLSFPGSVQASDRAELSFRVAGPLIELPVNAGDLIPRGQLLARLDPRDFEIAVAEARASLVKAEADYARFKNLYERNAVPLAELEIRLAQRDVAAANYDQAQANLRDTRLLAPFNGRVGRKYVENFEDVLAREPILTLHHVDIVEIVIDAPESIMATLGDADGRRFTASFFSAPGIEFDLRMTEATAEADPQTQTFQVTFSMPQPEEFRVLPGMTAEVNVYAGSEVNVYAGSPGDGIDAAEGFLIPAEAVFASESGESRVWVVDTSNLTVHQREVEVGRVTGENSIRILQGLERGETIAVAAVHQLQDGSTIRLMQRRN